MVLEGQLDRPISEGRCYHQISKVPYWTVKKVTEISFSFPVPEHWLRVGFPFLSSPCDEKPNPPRGACPLLQHGSRAIDPSPHHEFERASLIPLYHRPLLSVSRNNHLPHPRRPCAIRARSYSLRSAASLTRRSRHHRSMKHISLNPLSLAILP